MDQLVLEYWYKYRRLNEILKKSNLSRYSSEAKLLDVGGRCSTVLRLFKTPNRWVVDICIGELLKSGLDLNHRIQWICGKGERIPFPDQFFDAVFCSNVLDHVRDSCQVIREIYRVLKSEGFSALLVDIFHKADGSSQGRRDILHPHTFTKEYLDAMLSPYFDIVFYNTQPTKGKVGLKMLARESIHPHLDRQEYIYLLRRHQL